MTNGQQEGKERNRDNKYTEKEQAYIKKLMSGGMDRKRAEHYLHLMQTESPEDLRKASDEYIESLGGWEMTETEEFKKSIDALRKELGFKALYGSVSNGKLDKKVGGE